MNSSGEKMQNDNEKFQVSDFLIDLSSNVQIPMPNKAPGLK
jgi:hypothetical protein